MPIPLPRAAARWGLRACLLVALLPAGGCDEGPSTPVAPPAVVATAAPPAVPPPPTTVPPPLDLSCQASPRSGAAPLAVRFQPFPAGGTGTYDFAWQFGDGVTSNQVHPTHTYLLPGVFVASLSMRSGDQVRSCERAITVTAAAALPGPPGPGPAPPLPDLVITITGMNGALSYSPNPAMARVGQNVIWRNADAPTHTATANGGAFDTGLLAGGASSAPITMGPAGTFPYRCLVHPSMTGTLIVTP